MGLEAFVAPGRIVVKAGKGEKRNYITLCMGMAHIFVHNTDHTGPDYNTPLCNLVVGFFLVQEMWHAYDLLW